MHDADDAQCWLEILRSDSRAIGFMQSDCVTPADGSLKVQMLRSLCKPSQCEQ